MAASASPGLWVSANWPQPKGKGGAFIESLLSKVLPKITATEGEEATALGGLLKTGCSFSADTRVITVNGHTKPIKDIATGDTVTATDPTSGSTSAKTVTALHVNSGSDLADVTVQTPDAGRAVIHTTQNHPFWDATNQTWIEAGHLTPSHRLSALNPVETTVIGVVNFTGHQTMYNLTVADTHTYYVVAGTTPALVHNTGCGGTSGQVKRISMTILLSMVPIWDLTHRLNTTMLPET
jgi:Pretoxin HINT domain